MTTETKDNLRNVEARVLLDSRNPWGERLTSFILRYPRFIHSEMMTHRALSRNAASSRAIPTHRMIANVRENGAVPEYWGSKKAGMQSGEQLEGEDLEACKQIWHAAKMRAILASDDLSDRGLHKSLANRVIEPWVPYTALFSGTDWPHFFRLRAHPKAQPEFQVLAYRMLDAYLKSTPQPLQWGDWHIPFGDRMDPEWPLDTQLKVAIARCARTSYETFDGEIVLEKDLDLYADLMENDPMHASPAEHVARAEQHLWLSPNYIDSDAPVLSWFEDDWDLTMRTPIPYTYNLTHQGNYLGFTQYRKLQPREHTTLCDFNAIMDSKPDWITL